MYFQLHVHVDFHEMAGAPLGGVDRRLIKPPGLCKAGDDNSGCKGALFEYECFAMHRIIIIIIFISTMTMVAAKAQDLHMNTTRGTAWPKFCQNDAGGGDLHLWFFWECFTRLCDGVN